MPTVQLIDPKSGQVFDVDDTEAESAARDNRLVPATPEQVAEFDAGIQLQKEHGGLAGKAGAVVKTALATPAASFAGLGDRAAGAIQDLTGLGTAPGLNDEETITDGAGNAVALPTAGENLLRTELPGVGAPLAFTVDEKAKAERAANPISATVGAAIPDIATGVLIPGAGLAGLAASATASGLMSEGAESLIQGDEYSLADAGLYIGTGFALEGIGTLALKGAMKAKGLIKNHLDVAVDKAQTEGVQAALKETDPTRAPEMLRRNAEPLYDLHQTELDDALGVIETRLTEAPESLFKPSVLRKTVSGNRIAQQEAALNLAAGLDNARQVADAPPELGEIVEFLFEHTEGTGAEMFDALRQARREVADLGVDSPMVQDALEAMDASLRHQPTWGKAAKDYDQVASEVSFEGADSGVFNVRDLAGRDGLDGRLERARQTAKATGDKKLAEAVAKAERAVAGADRVTGAKVMGGGTAPEIDDLRAKVTAFDDRVAPLADEMREALEGLDEMLEGDLTDLGANYKRVAKIVPTDAASLAKQSAWRGTVADGADTLRAQLGVSAAPGNAALGASADVLEALNAPGVKTWTKNLDSTLQAMSKSAREAKTTEEIFLSIYQGKQSLQKLVKRMGQSLTQTAGLAERQGLEMLQEMTERFQDETLQGLYRREVWGDAADFMSGVNKALHKKVIPASRAVAQDFQRILGREYMTNKPIGTYAPEMIRGHVNARMQGSTTADEQLRLMLSGAEDIVAVQRKWGTADPAKLAKGEKYIKTIRDRLAEVDEIPVAKRRIRDYDAKPQSLTDRLLAKGGAKLASKAISGAAGFVAGGPVGGIVGAMAGDLAEPLVEKAIKSGAGKRARDFFASSGGGPVATAQSAAYQRAQGLLDKRKGQTGAVLISGTPGPAIDKFATKVQRRLDKFETRTGKTAELEAENDAAQEAFDQAEQAIADADTPAADSAARSALAAAEKRLQRASAKLERGAPDKGPLEDALAELKESHTSAIDELLDGAEDASALSPEARARHDAIQASLDELEALRVKHTTSETLPSGDLYETEDTASIAREFLEKLSREDTEAGFVESGPGVGDILTSPMGLTAGAGLGAAAVHQLAPEQQEAQERAERVEGTRQKLGFLATQGRATVAVTARAMANPVKTERTVPTVPGVTASSGVAEFMGGQDSLRSAYDAKRETLLKLEQDPMLLVDELTDGLGELADSAPELHAKLTAQTFKVVQFLQSKLPATIGASLSRPEGTPPNMLAVKQFALYYSAATAPKTVLKDLANNRARREQVDTLRELWEPTYDALKSQIIGEMSQHRPTVAQRLRLDLLFDFGDSLDAGLSNRLMVLANRPPKEQAQPGPKTMPSRKTQPSVTGTSATASLNRGAASPLA